MTIYKTTKRLQPLLSCIYLVLQISLLIQTTATAPAPAAREAAKPPTGQSASSATAEATPRREQKNWNLNILSSANP